VQARVQHVVVILIVLLGKRQSAVMVATLCMGLPVCMETIPTT